MSHIYWELHEIPQPSDSYINHSDGRVFLMTEDGLGKKKRKVIGRATSETMMHPNDLFRYLYPHFGRNTMVTGTCRSMNFMQGCMPCPWGLAARQICIQSFRKCMVLFTATP